MQLQIKIMHTRAPNSNLPGKRSRAEIAGGAESTTPIEISLASLSRNENLHNSIQQHVGLKSSKALTLKT